MSQANNAIICINKRKLHSMSVFVMAKKIHHFDSTSKPMHAQFRVSGNTQVDKKQSVRLPSLPCPLLFFLRSYGQIFLELFFFFPIHLSIGPSF